MFRSTFAAVLLGACLASRLAAQPADARAPIPQKTETAAAEKLVHEIFKAEFAKTKPADRSALAAKLLEQAEASKNDIAARYVLINEACIASAKAGDAVSYLKSAEMLSQSYKISLAEAQAANVDSLALGVTKDGARDAGAPLLEAADAALGNGEFDTAQKLLHAADATSRKGGIAALTHSVGLRTKSLAVLRKEFEKLDNARKKLETTPTDADANLMLGRFLCFVKNDWEGGLPRLVLGSDTALRSAAEKDDKANTGASTDKAEAGDVWYKIGMSMDPLQKSHIMGHALVRYRGAMTDANGLAKIRIEKRIEELTKLTDGPSATGSSGTGAGVRGAALVSKLAGKASYDQKTGVLTVVYNFSDRRQLKDFECGEAKPGMARNVLVLDAATSIRHVVQYDTLAVSAVLGVKRMVAPITPAIRMPGRRPADP